MGKRLSIGVIGSGIAGLYCAWKLARKGHSVTVFECLNRLGGRIETLDLDGFKAECGPMRFELGIQPLFDALAKELQVTFNEFSPHKGEPVKFPLYKLDNNEKSTEQLEEENSVKKQAAVSGSDSKAKYSSPIEPSHLTSSLDLLKFGVYRIVNSDKRHLSLPQVVESEKYRKSVIDKYAGKLPNDDDLEPSNTYHETEIAKCAEKLFKENFMDIRSGRRLEKNGLLLYRIGFWNALAHVLSPGAVAKIRDIGTFYHLMPENPSASEWSIFWLRAFHPNGQMSTIAAGVQTIVTRLVDKLNALPRKDLVLLTNATVIRVGHGETLDKIRVGVVTGQQVSRQRLDLEFDHVILALPQWPLLRLAEFFPRQIRDYIEGVIGFPLLKAFLVTNDPWWDDETLAQYGAQLVPTRELHYFPDSKRHDTSHPGPLGMVMLYTDRPATAYWQPYVHKPHFTAQRDKPDELKDELVKHLLVAIGREAGDKINKISENPEEETLDLAPTEAPPWQALLKIALDWAPTVASVFTSRTDILVATDIARAIGHRALELLRMPEAEAIDAIKRTVTTFAIRDWSQPPFGAAAHAWAPGIDVPEALNRLKAFSLLGREGINNVHICGEAYSDYQGFIEGALRSAEGVLEKIE